MRHLFNLFNFFATLHQPPACLTHPPLPISTAAKPFIYLTSTRVLFMPLKISNDLHEFTAVHTSENFFLPFYGILLGLYGWGFLC